LEQETLRDAFARLPGAVVLVATRDATGFRGATATSFVAVSVDPPLVLVCLDRPSATGDAVVADAAFTISLLARGQEFLADRFSGRAPAVDGSWRDVAHRLGANGLPLLEGAVGWFECRLESVMAGGDHDILLGAVTGVGRGPGEPLLHWERGYWTLGR
jgi:flavin reductase (DIM6/NTAB) family NADH-FMN oxidoreductase RutF